MDSHGAIVLNLLNKQRQETSDPKLTDTTLKPTLDPQKRNLRCHRVRSKNLFYLKNYYLVIIFVKESIKSNKSNSL